VRVSLRQIEDVVEHGLCAGCGACAGMSPTTYAMRDHEHDGRRPERRPGAGVDDAQRRVLMDVCPGVNVRRDRSAVDAGIDVDLEPDFGPVIAVWEGHAADVSTRYRASSGGVITALAAYGVEQGGMTGVLHIRAHRERPLENETVLSTTGDAVRAATGSRYAPASPAEGIPLIEGADGPCIFIGKPCDVAAVQRARRHRPELDRNCAITIALFCAGTPSTAGTRAMLARMGVTADDVRHVRYRGHGWPGRATAGVATSAGLAERTLSYEQAWGEILSKHTQWRCRICPDHAGELADIAVGDPWDDPPKGDEPGRSLVVARTARGRVFIERAISASAVELTRVDARRLRDAQPNLRRARGASWGRRLAMRLCGQPAPRFDGLSSFHAWRTTLSSAERVRSILGTIRRMRRGEHRPAQMRLDPPTITITHDATTQEAA